MPFDAVPIVITVGVVAVLVWMLTSGRRNDDARRGSGDDAATTGAIMGAGYAGTYASSHRDEDPTHGGDAGPVDSGSYVHGDGGGGGGGDFGGGGDGGGNGGGGD